MDKIKGYLLKYKSFIAYGVVGGLSTAINILLYYLFAHILNIYYLLAVALAFILTTFIAFWGNKYLVFCSKTKGLRALCRELFKFMSLRLLMGGFDVSFMYVSVTLLSFNDFAMKITSNIIVIICNYILSKKVIFRKRI